MPQIVNPSRGFIASANNDPIGTTLDNDPLNQLRPGGGIYYLSPAYAIGDRVARITKLLPALRALLELPFEHVIVSHGEPVHDRAEFEQALERVPWGEAA